MKSYLIRFAPWSEFLRLLVEGWVPSDLWDERYPAWTCVMEKEVR
jgi:hypothetical protein